MDNKEYVDLLIGELFNHIDKVDLDLTDPKKSEIIGKLFTKIKGQRNKRTLIKMVGLLDENQFDEMLIHLRKSNYSTISKLLFITNNIKNEDDLLKALMYINKNISKRQIMSKYNYAFGRYSRMTIKSKIPYGVFCKLKPLARLKVLRVLAMTKEYPFIEKIDKKDIEIELFPLAFEYGQAIKMFVENWKW